MSSPRGYPTAMPVSPPPPTDLPTYARSMHQHTKQQMEAASRTPHHRSGSNYTTATSSMPNSTSSSGSRGSGSSGFSYRT